MFSKLSDFTYIYPDGTTTTNFVLMDLIIPSRSKPSGASFPTAPRKVRQWIGQLYPVTSSDSTRVLVRGLKHCNRLENSVKSRMDILESFRPVVRELTDFAVSHYAGQNLPLNARERNSFNTVTTLLQEMAFGYKIVVNDTLNSSVPGTSKHRNLAILHAMEALDEIALRHLQVYEEIPYEIWQDVNTLYKIAEDLQIEQISANKLKSSTVSSSNIREIFIRIHLLAISGSSSFRRGQILQLHKYITQHVDQVELINPHLNTIGGNNLMGVDLACNAPATDYTFMDPKYADGFRVFFLDDYLNALDKEIANTPNSVSALYEADVLTQESLIRLKKNHLAQKRSHSRQFFHQPVELIHGLKEIYATLCYKEPQPEEPVSRDNKPELTLSISGIVREDYSSNSSRNPKFDNSSTHEDVWNLSGSIRGAGHTSNNKTSSEDAFTNTTRGEWYLINQSIGGLGLVWQGSSSPQLTVGELVASKRDLEQNSNDWLIGVACWVRSSEEQRLFTGVTHIAKNSKPVLIERTKGGHNSITTQTECLLAQLLDDESSDCLITPAYMFHAGEVVIIRGHKSINRFRLTRKVDSSGSFALYLTEQVGSSVSREGLMAEEARQLGIEGDNS